MSTKANKIIQKLFSHFHFMTGFISVTFSQNKEPDIRVLNKLNHPGLTPVSFGLPIDIRAYNCISHLDHDEDTFYTSL